MWTQAGALLLLFACCLWSAEAQKTQSIWDDPIQFRTKAQDLCRMSITGQGEYTRLRLSCQGGRRSYWCEYVGKPYTCRPYNKNPRHYFTQMMWGLKKLNNACQAPRQIKPHMCRNAGDESQMHFSSASFSRHQPRPVPTRPDSNKQASTKTITPRVKTTQSTSPQPTTPPVETYAKKTARQYCWKSLEGICLFAIRLFRD